MSRLENNSTNYSHPQESHLYSLHYAMDYREDGKPALRVITTFDGNIVIEGDVNIPGTVTVNSTPEDPIHNHIVEVGTSGLLTVPYMPIGGTVTVNQPVAVTDNNGSLTVDGSVSVSNFPATYPITDNGGSITVDGSVSATVSGTVELGATTLSALENINAVISDGGGSITVDGTVSVNQPVAVTDNGSTLSIDDGGGSITVDGTVTATIIDVITVIVDEDAGENFSFNNHATNTNRGWTMDNTMRPVISIRVTDTGTTVADLVKITEYEIGNNNANQSTIIYEWYEGPLTISGAAIPAWTNAGTKTQYRVYQDQYSSNQGNTFTVPAGTHMRHSGIIIGKNSADDEGPATLKGGATPNMLTLCMKRVDNANKLDVWFAFTIKELA